MSLLLNAQLLAKAYGAQSLFQNVSLTIQEGDRLGLIGPNGAGKSTLLRILAGLETADAGQCAPRRRLKLRYVAQQPAFPEAATVAAVLRDALIGEGLDPGEIRGRVSTTLGLAGFETGGAPLGDSGVALLSGGWRRRLALAAALIAQPDVLLLDEPTNHLDLEGVLWLERVLRSAASATVIVSHDRTFLERTVTAMAELNRVYPDGLFRVPGVYSEFLQRREDYLAAREQHREALANRVRREVEWLQRGAKARTSKSKARIGSAGKMMEELADMNARRATGSAQIDFQASGRKTRKLIELQQVGVRFGDRGLFTGLDLVLSPGTRLGLIGANGSGKTTLLRVLTGELEPSSGEVRRAEGLRVVYFDQSRQQLDPASTLRRTLAPAGDAVIHQEQVVHVAGWAKRFLFRPEQLDTAVGRLSGGEQARLLIARLMLQPADLLLLDEPTNDLDIPTLEVLEENLSEFRGALVLVTHDRYLLDRVSTRLLGLNGAEKPEFFADLEQWERERREQAKPAPRRTESVTTQAKPAAPRLSYLELRDWEGMEAKILAAEAHLASRAKQLEDPQVVTDPERGRRAYDEFEAARAEVDRLYTRWAELGAKLQP